ncbi:MAG TPA: alcohol dehydrogenase catalytic domain-containing protein [Actinomycetota bacterium]
MRAIRIDGPRRVALVDMPRPEPSPGDVLVRVASAALCAVDRRLAERGTERPRVPGHEIAGTLEDGTPVGVHPNIGCGRCEWCRQGFVNRCPDHEDLGRDRDGGLAEWIAVPADHVVPLEGLDLETAPLVEPLSTIVHAQSLLAVDGGDRVAVVGAGPLGILGMWMFRRLGATVAVVQRSEERRRLALRLGADAAVGPGDDVDEPLGGPPHAILVTAPGADPLTWALERVAEGGIVHSFAGTAGGMPVDANLVHYRHLRLVGSTGCTVEEFRQALELARSGAIPVAELPRVTVPLERVPAVLLDPAPDPGTLKVMVRPDGSPAPSV